MRKLLFIFALFLPALAFSQATAGYHRVSQVLARGTGVSAQVVPYATVAVTNTGTGLAGVIYADPALTVRVPNSVVTSDANGNFGYYFNLNLCMTEKITFPNGGGFTQVNICSNGGSGGCPTSPCQISGGGTSATTAAGALSNLGGLSLVQTGLQTMAGPLKVPSIITPSVSKGVVLYASAACAVNSNILSGGGTDDSTCIQGLLNKINSAGGGTLVQDGVSLLSAANVPGGPTGQTTALQMGPYTTIACTNNGGFYLSDNSNVTMLGNNISGNPSTSLFQHNMTLDSCTFNENGANQSRYEQGNSNNGWVFGIWFGGFDTLTLRNVYVYNARTFGIVLGNGQTVFGNNVAVVQLAGEGSGGNNHDGLHFFGTLKYVNISDFIDGFGDDDALAFNTDEGVYSFNNSPLGWQISRYPNSGGDIDDVTIDNVFLNGVNDVLRWIGYTTPGGVPTVSNVVVHNVHGTVNNFVTTLNNVTATGGVTLDGWHVTNSGGGGSTLYIPPNASPLWINDISSLIAISFPSGVVGSVQMVPTISSVNNGVLNGLNAGWRSSPLAILSLDASGNLYLGNDQPQSIFRAGGINGAYLNNTGGSGYTTTWQFPSNTRLQANGIAVTANNTIDDGSGNASVAGNFFVNNTFRLTSPNSPTVSAGTVSTYSTNNGMAITGLSSATSVTITFNPSWINYAFCTASPSVSLAAAPYVTSMSKTAATFTFPSLTGALFVVCNGN